MTSDYDHQRFGYGRIQEFERDKQRGFILHERHIFLCYGNRRSWPADFVLGGPDSLPARLTSALKSREDQISRKTILTICEPSRDPKLEKLKVGDIPIFPDMTKYSPKLEELKEGDVLIFPDMIKYRLNPSTVDSFITKVIVNNQIWSRSPMVPLRQGSYVFVCAHGTHDRRSGVCGQLVLEKLNELVTINCLEDKLFPIPCSDIGMPEFAANLIIFARDGKNEIDGHWYGYVSPEEVSAILSMHLVRGLVSHHRWRGKMGNKKILGLRAYPEWWWWRGDDGSIGRIKEEGVEMVGWDWLRPVPAVLESCKGKTLLPTPLYTPLRKNFERRTFTKEECKAHLEQARSWKLGGGRMYRPGY